jgi:uncharacterized protein (DUF427 family)
MGIRTEPIDRWVRAYVGDVAVADTRQPLLFWDEGVPVPFYAIPRADVRADLLRPAADGGRGHPFFRPQGPVAQMYDLVVGDRTLPRAAWVRADPALEEHVVLTWEPGVLDRWTEEDEEVAGHPKDPHHRVDALHSSRHVVLTHEEQVVAESQRPVLLFETSLPTRYYLPPDDVALDKMTEVPHTTMCPYKGTADRYWSLPGLSRVAWCYSDPGPSVGAIAGRIAFYTEFVDVTVDGERLPRPVTPFSAARP